MICIMGLCTTNILSSTSDRALLAAHIKLGENRRHIQIYNVECDQVADEVRTSEYFKPMSRTCIGCMIMGPFTFPYYSLGDFRSVYIFSCFTPFATDQCVVTYCRETAGSGSQSAGEMHTPDVYICSNLSQYCLLCPSPCNQTMGLGSVQLLFG